MDSLSMVEIAAKQRHVLLLKKVRNNQPLSAGELRELKDYEESMAKKQPKKASKQTTKKAVKKPTDSQTTKRPSPVKMKNWALKYETMAECEQAEGLDFELNSLMRFKTLKAAWERGQFLRKLQIGGRGNATLEQIEFDLQMAEGTLEPILEKDDEAREMYNNSRYATIAKVQAGIVDAVNAGKLTPTTLKQLDTFLRTQIVTKDVDFDKVPTAVMEDLFGVTRQTLIDWKKTRGMPANADGVTYNLRACLRQTWREKDDGTRERVPCWFEEMLRDKIVAQPGKYSGSKQNDGEWLRNEKVRRQIAEIDRLLIPADRSMASFLARASAIDKYIAAHGENLYLDIADRSEDEIRKKLAEYNDGIRLASCQLPPNYPELLPEKIAPKFIEIMQELAAIGRG